MRIVKIAALVVGGVIALIVVALVLVVMFVDPNDYRPDIERMVQEKTGRELTLSGDLKLSIFPWLALQAGPASLGDAPGFGDEPFVSIQEARVGVRLLPLLGGKVEVGTVRLTGARIRLVKDAQGRDNWADLADRPQTSENSSSAATPLPSVAGLEVRDAAITIENRQAQTRQTIRDFNLDTGRFRSGEPFSLKTDFVFDQDAAMSVKVQVETTVTADLASNVHRLAEPQIDLVVSGQGYPAQGIAVKVRATSLDADLGQEIHRLNGLTLATTWKGAGFPPAGVPISLTAADLNINMAQQTLELTGLDAEVAGAHLSGALSGTEIIDAPSIAGPLRLDPVALREWLPKLGIQLPATRDPKVFSKLSFAGNVALTKTSALLNDVNLQLDDTTAKGMAGISDFAAKALRFDLNIDTLNADRYLPPPVDAPAAPATPAGDEPPTPLPMEALRTLNARGQIQVNQATFADIKFTKLRLGVNARDGKVRLNPSEASMYGGTYSGDIGIDATAQNARVTLDEHIRGIDFAPLFKDFFDTTRVSGKGSANLKLSGVGRTTDDILKTLGGAIDFSVADGALEGTDLWYEIRRARAVLKQQAVPERPTPVRTTFSALKGTGSMKDGVLSNNDLDIATQYLKVTGQGTVDIPQNTLDYRLMAAVLKIPREGAETAEAQDLVDAQIPVKVTGTLSDPKVRPDLEGYVKGKVQEKIDKERDKVEQKIKDKLGDKLKDLFNR